jgi:hypothetical protein
MTAKKTQTKKAKGTVEQKKIKEICLELKDIDQANHVDYLRDFINQDMNPSHLKVVRNENGSIRIHAEWKETGTVVNMNYKGV